MTKPFVKWAGGKMQILPQIIKQVPKKINTYYEPFLGGGALFFSVLPNNAVLSDINQRLIRTYLGIKNNPLEVIDLLKSYPTTEDFFIKLKNTNIDDKSDVEVAAWLIYLNKTCFNGLYRVNKNNIFNVPYGKYNNPSIYDEENILNCSKALSNAVINDKSFEAAVENAKEGDFVYFDPPYIPISATSSFTSYTANGFDLNQQIKLRDLALQLKNKGVFVLLSNSSSSLVKQLYGSDFKLIKINSARNISSKSSSRGKIKEYLIC